MGASSSTPADDIDHAAPHPAARGGGDGGVAAAVAAGVWWSIGPGDGDGDGSMQRIYFHGTTGALRRSMPSVAGDMVIVRNAPPALYTAVSALAGGTTAKDNGGATFPARNANHDRTSPPSVWNGGKFWKVKDAVQWTDSSKAFRTLAAGGMAGAISKTCVAPLERIKLLLQIHGMTFKRGTSSPGILGVTKRILMEDGPIGFFRGNTANVARIIPTKGVLFMCNDYYRALFNVSPTSPEPTRLVMCGSAAGITATLCTYPLDLVRSRLMMGASASGEVLYTGIGDCFAKTFRAEGVRGFYGGLGPTLLGIVPYAGVSFASFDLLKTYMPKDDEGHTPTKYKLVCGASAGFISQTVSYPVDTVRRRMQLQGSRVGVGHTDAGRLYSSSLACAASVLRNEGFAGFYRGLSANLLRAAPNTAIQFTAYGQLCHLLGIQDQKK